MVRTRCIKSLVIGTVVNISTREVASRTKLFPVACKKQSLTVEDQRDYRDRLSYRRARLHDVSAAEFVEFVIFVPLALFVLGARSGWTFFLRAAPDALQGPRSTIESCALSCRFSPQLVPGYLLALLVVYI